MIREELRRCFWSAGDILCFFFFLLFFFFAEVLITQLFDFKFFEQYVCVLCILLHIAISIFFLIPQQGKKRMPISR